MDLPRPDWSRYRKTLLISLKRARIAVFEQLTEARPRLVSLRTPEGRRAGWRAVRPLVVFAVAYIAAWSYLFIAAFLGAKPPPAPLFPPGAVLLCALLLTSPRRWWLYLLAAFVIQVPILAYLHLPLWWNLVGFIPDAVEPILAALLLRRFLALPPRFVSLRETSIYTACVTAAVAVAATVGSVVNAIGGEQYWSAWRTWFLGDTLSALILAPTILLWVAVGVRGLRADSRWRYAEVGLLYGGLLALGVATFDTRLFAVGIAGAAIYLPVPLLLWAAVRFGPRGIASALSLIVILAIPAVANALGPFASVSIPAPSLLDQLFELQLFLLMIGVPLFFLATLVQERQQTELSLQASEARYRAAFESSATGMMLVSIDGHSLHVNRPLVEMLGYSEDELRARPFADFTHPDDLEPNLTLFRQAVAGEIDGYRLEKRFIKKQGDIVWGILSAGVVSDVAGKPLYLVGQIENITERKQLEQEREEARAQAERHAEELGRVFEAMADGVAVFNQEGRHLRSNEAYQRLLGLDTVLSDYSEMSLHERKTLLAVRNEQGWPIAPEETPLARALKGEVLADEQAVDLRVRTLDGREVELRVSAAPIRAPTGQIVGAVSIYRDVTEPKRLERALAEQAKQLTAVMEAVPDPLIVYDMDGRVVIANAAYHTLVERLIRQEPPGTTVRERVQQLGGFFALDGMPLEEAAWAQTRALQGEVLAGSDAVEMMLYSSAGGPLYFSMTAAPLRDSAGLITGAVGMSRDVTAYKQVEHERAAALVASETWFHTLADTAPVLVWVSGPDGLVNFVNLPWLQFTGRASEQELGNGWAEGVHPDDYDRCLQTYRTAFQARERFTMEYRLRRADGEYRWLMDTGLPRFAPDGAFLGYIGSAMDINERLQLEQECREAREQAERQAEELDRVFEAMADGVAVYGQDGEILRANAAQRRLLGVDAAPPAFAQLSLPERFALFAGRDAQGQPTALKDGPLLRALSGEVFAGADSVEGRLRTLDGREVELRVSAAPIHAPTGQIVGAVLVCRDVTEPKQLERALAEQAEQLNRIFEGITDGLVVYDADGQVLRTNVTARRILGLDAAQADYAQVSTHSRAVLYEAYDEEGRQLTPEDWPLIRVLKGLVADADARDVRLHVLDGREVDIHTSAAPLRDGTGRLVGAVSILHDQTERRRLEREREEVRARELAVREVNQRLDIFATMAAHDLSSPVAVSRMVVQRARALLDRTVADTGTDISIESGTDSNLAQTLARATEAVVTTEESLDRLWRLVQQLLDVARAKEGTLALNRQTTDLSELLRTCVEEQRMLTSSRVIELNLPDPADLTSSIIVDADVGRLGQVVTNYLSNAERYSSDDQSIEVTLRLADEDAPDTTDATAERHAVRVARVEVCDQGVGIAEEDKQTVWNRFQRAASVDEATGLGLGLYIVRTIVELHGGHVGVESALGQGSTFWFTLPLLAAPAIDATSHSPLDDQTMST